MLSLFLASMIAAAPDAGVADAGTPVPAFRAPFGHIGDVVTAVAEGGFPASERVITAKLPGCERLQAIWVTRFLLGVAEGGAQVHGWLVTQPQLKAKLFGKKDPLAETITRARRTAPRAMACKSGADWRLKTTDFAERPCAEPLSTVPADHVFDDKAKLSQLVRVFPAEEGAKDRCRPRLSAVLSDDKRVPRLVVHADYGGDLVVEVLGDKCQLLTFDFDKPSQSFIPRTATQTDCPPKRK